MKIVIVDSDFSLGTLPESRPWQRVADLEGAYACLELDPHTIVVLTDHDVASLHDKLKRLGTLYPEAAVLILQQELDTDLLLSCMDLGARDFLTHDQASDPQILQTKLEAITRRVYLEERLKREGREQALAKFAGGLAHDLNNVLAVIDGNASLLEDEQASSEELHYASQAIYGATSSLTRLGKQLLSIAQGDVFMPVTTDLNSSIHTVLRTVPAHIKTKVDFDTRCEPNLWRVQADPNQIEALLRHIVENAAEATDGRGRIEVVSRNVQRDSSWVCLDHGDHEEGDYVEVSIRDHGRGMSPDECRAAFAPFFTTKASSRGLGLAAAAGIVRIHEGCLEIDSRPNEGCEVRILLPKGPCVERLPRVLFIEDEEIMRQLMSRALTREGFEVCEAADGATARRLLRRHLGHFDVMVLDLQLPDSRGASLYRDLRRLEPGIPILVTSGLDETDARDMLGIPVEDWTFLPKPYSPAMIVERLESLLCVSPLP